LSEAKPIVTRRILMGIASLHPSYALSPRRPWLRILATKMPEGASILRPSKRGGRRERRVFVAPAALRASEESTQASHYRYAETVRRSLRNGLRLIPRSPRSAGLDSLRRLPSLADLIPASGNRDHAALLVRETIARLAKCPRPSHPVPTFVAIGQTPLLTGSGMRGSNHRFLKNGSR
jgi:hypothetical protein